MKTVLVTGGTGYIGSHTAVELIENGYQVLIVDNLSNSQEEVLDGIEQITGIRPAFEKFDLCDRPKVFSLFENYSIDAIAAALPAGIIAYVFLIFFADTAGYVSVIIAQYTGAGALQRVGSALWQAIYFAFISWLIMVGLSFSAGPLFRWVGHSAEVQQLEVIYFRVLCLGSGIHIIGMSLSSFFTGRGVTRPVGRIEP